MAIGQPKGERMSKAAPRVRVPHRFLRFSAVIVRHREPAAGAPRTFRRTSLAERLLQAAAAAALLAGVSLFGGMVHRQLWEAAQLADYRSTLQEICDAVRVMRWRAVSGRQPYELRIDPLRRSFQVVAFDGRSALIERTIWLPTGLEVLEAPQRLGADRNGGFPPAAIVVSAPGHNRLFRITTTARGFVQCHEEPSL